MKCVYDQYLEEEKKELEQVYSRLNQKEYTQALIGQQLLLSASDMHYTYMHKFEQHLKQLVSMYGLDGSASAQIADYAKSRYKKNFTYDVSIPLQARQCMKYEKWKEVTSVYR